MSGENRFSPYRGILTEHVTTNRRVDYFLHILHEKFVTTSSSRSSQFKLQNVSLDRMLDTAALSNRRFRNTLRGGDLAEGLEDSLSFEALMFFSDVSAHLKKVKANQEPNASVFRTAVDNVLALGETRDVNNPVSKVLLLKVIALVLGDSLTNNKGNPLPIHQLNGTNGHSLRSFKGKVTGSIDIKDVDDLARSFAALVNTVSNTVDAKVGDAPATVSNLPQVTTFTPTLELVPGSAAVIGGQTISERIILANNLTDAQNVQKCSNDLQVVGSGANAQNRLTIPPVGCPTTSTITADPALLKSNINDDNLVSRMRISDTHSALYWENKGLMEYSPLVQGKIGCDLKKHYVATIALAGGKRKWNAGETAEIAQNPLKTVDVFPSAITHITSAHFEGGHAKSSLQWTSQMEPELQIYLVMLNSTDQTHLDKVKTNSNKKWKAEGGGLLPAGDQAWNVSQQQKQGLYNRADATNYPTEFAVPINFESLADGSKKPVKDQIIIGEFISEKLNDPNFDEKLLELKNFYNTNKSVTSSYSSNGCDKESSISLFTYNLDMVISDMMRNGSVLPISGDVDDSEDYEPRNWNMQNGEYVDEDGVVATIKGYTDAGKWTVSNNCYTLGAAPASNGKTCEDFMLNCLAGENVSECKNFLQRTDFWEISSAEVDAMIPEMGGKILDRFGFKKSGDQYESPSSWVQGLTSNTSMGGLSQAEATSIGGNTKLIGWLGMVVNKTNSMPDSVPANTSLAGQWLVRKVGLPIKSSGVNGQVVSIDSLVHHILNRRRALAVHLLSPSVPVYGMIGGGDQANNWELLAHNARKEVYDSLEHLESTFNGLREQIQAHGKEISPADLQEIKGEFKKQRAATDKLIKYIKYMEKYAVLKELYAVNDSTGKVLNKEGMQMLVNKNKEKFQKFTNAEDNTIQILRNMRSELDRLLN